ncbi:MAG: glycosyltransferase family 4 protein [archaeon]
MRILFVSPHFFPFIGGAENYILRICRQLKKLNHEVIVFTSTENAVDFDGIKVYSFPALFRYSNTPFNFWGSSISKIIEKEKPEVIVGSLSTPFMADSAARLAEKKNIPFFLVYFNDYIKQNFLEKIFLNFYFFFVLRKTFSLSRKIIVLSDYYAKKSVFLRSFLDKTVSISPFVDLTEFKPVKNLVLENERTVLFVGALNKGQKYKGLDYLIKAVLILKKDFPEIKLVVVGEGNNRSFFEEMCRKAGIAENTVFAGNVSHEKLLLFYSQCTTLVLPSTSNSEGFGLVLLEAMAFSKPVIGSNIGGIPAVIQHNFNGLLVEPKNEKKLSEAIKFIFLNPKKAKELGLNGFMKVKQLSPEKITKALMNLFEEALNEKNN